MPVTKPVEETPAAAKAQRLANARGRVQELLQDPEFAARARAAMEPQEGSADEIVERAHAGEFAERAFIDGYGAELVRGLKSRYGG